MKIYMRLMLLITIIAVNNTYAKPAESPMKPYRPSLREMVLEEVQIDRFRVTDPEDGKWLDIPQGSVVAKRAVQGSDNPEEPLVMGSLHK